MFSGRQRPAGEVGVGVAASRCTLADRRIGEHPGLVLMAAKPNFRARRTR
jgi:hypothetical protein